MKQVPLEAKRRKKKGKEYCRQIRRNGFIPAVLYGKNYPAVHIEVPEKEFKKALSTHSGQNVILELKMSGNGQNSQLAMISEIQKNPLGKSILHIDFHKISLDIKVTAEVPVHVHGEPVGAKRGGIFDQVIWSIEVEALPMSVPDRIDLNISHLDLEDSIAIRDIVPPEGVTIIGEPDAIVVIVHPPRTTGEVAEGAEGVPVAAAATEKTSEPAVIKKGKEEKEA